MLITYRWLGVAGLEFTCEGYTLLVDPFFTRPGKLALLSGRPAAPDAALIARHAPKADAVLVTHPHYDHLMDVPEVLRGTGARAYGSPNTCALLALNGIARDRVGCIHVGDRLTLGPFSVEVFPARHTKLPFSRWLDGPLSKDLHRAARRPLRLSDYRMDACYSFRIRAGDRSLLVGNHPADAGALFMSPYHSPELVAAVLREVRPLLVVPIHWDDFTLPLSHPLEVMLITPAQGLRPVFPPVRRIDLDAFARHVRLILPGAVVRRPELFQTVEID